MTSLAVAHRAGNDPAALEAALELGVDALEVDVHLRAGRLEVRHSKHLRPLPLLWDRGPGGFELTRLLEGPELADVLAAVDGRAGILLDLKGPGRVGREVADLLEARPPEQPVLVCSRWWPNLEALAGREWARPVLTARNPLELARLRRRVRTSHRPYGVSVHRSLLAPGTGTELREGVTLLLTWGVNDPTTLEEVTSQGVNGIISDSPEVLRQVLEGRGGTGRPPLLGEGWTPQDGVRTGSWFTSARAARRAALGWRSAP